MSVCRYAFLLFLLGGMTATLEAAKFLDLGILDESHLIIHFSDGDVTHDEGGSGETVLRYTPELDTAAATVKGNWTITSADDPDYSAGGRHPSNCYRKTKLSGHAQLEWSGGDYNYAYTYEHWIYLELPSPLQQGADYTLEIASATNTDDTSEEFTFDIYTSRSEAIHVNLIGYAPDAPHKAADLYHWMGSGGARSYASFEGTTVHVYDVNSFQSFPAGTVGFWMSDGSDVFGYNFTRSDVWNIDFSSFTSPGTYRLVLEGIGCSRDFQIADDIYKDPFAVIIRGYFYMRIGDSNPQGLTPPPRTPLYLPGISPPSTTVYLTTMQPWHPDWGTFSSGDPWDRPDDWAAYRKSGNPTNPDAWGGHSDAADWDRHLGHVANIYDMLLPFLMTDGGITDDDTGISESGNNIPDILDEARFEVDFWLRLRDGDGYSNGLTNPNGANELFQAGPTAIAAWANAANSAMLADAFRVAGLSSLMEYYRDEAVTAYNHANGLADPMLDEGLHPELDDGALRGRDLKMMAAAYLYNVTGNTAYEDVVNAESVCSGGPAELINSSRNQLWASAGYLITPQNVNYPTLQANMKTAIINEAKTDEADLIDSRPSRRGTDRSPAAFWRTAQNMDRSIIAHAVADTPSDINHFRKALALEADWGLGRNPLNTIEMTTAHTPLASKRSYVEIYTSGRDDGVSGVHPGHTPYLNLSDWSPGMVMGRPSALYENSYPQNVPSTWPMGEAYFPSRWVWAHSEFTPRQTMRGKIALYAYLYGLAGGTSPANPSLIVNNTGIAGGMGTVTSSPPGIDCGSDCTENYSNGTTVTLTALPAGTSVFAGWDGACFGENPSCEVIMSNHRSVTANFEPVGLTYSLTVAREGSGDGTITSSPAGIDCGEDCFESYLKGTTVELTASADGDSTFTAWGGACSGSGSCTVTMSSARSVTATFRSTLVAAVIVYDDALGSGWADWSWSSTIDLAGTSPVHDGSHAVDATLGAWGAFAPAMPSGAIDTSGYEAVGFWVHGGSGADKNLRFYSEGGGSQSQNYDFTALAGTWTEITITLDQLGNPGLISRLNFFNNSESAIGIVSFDQIRLEPTDFSIFADGFESGDTSNWGFSPQRCRRESEGSGVRSEETTASPKAGRRINGR